MRVYISNTGTYTTRELELYNADFLQKPSMLLINKMDSEGSFEKYQEIQERLRNLQDHIKDYPEDMRPDKVLKFCDIIPISAKEDPSDVDIVKDRVRKLLDVLDELEAKQEKEANAELYKKTRRSFVERGPSLI